MGGGGGGGTNTAPTPTPAAPLPHQLQSHPAHHHLHPQHPPSENIITSEQVEEIEVNTTMTDKIVDVQNAGIHSRSVLCKIIQKQNILYRFK